MKIILNFKNPDEFKRLERQTGHLLPSPLSLKLIFHSSYLRTQNFITGRESITPASYCSIAAASLPVMPEIPSQSALIFA